MSIDNYKHKGFSLLEVMIAVLILSIGLLGLANLQILALKYNESAYLRNQALVLIDDIYDRMVANQSAANLGEYNQTMVAGKPGAGSVANDDITNWLTNIDVLPGGDGSISCVDSDITDAFICSPASVYTITVQWIEIQDQGDDRGNRALSNFSHAVIL